MRGIPALLKYQIVATAILWVIVRVLDAAARGLMHMGGRVAVTTGDLAFLYASWEGWLLILLALVVAIAYVVIDVNAKVLCCGHIIRREKVSVWNLLKETFAETRRFFHPKGFLVFLYVVAAVPIAGVGLSTRLTANFRIPNFIMDVIYATPLYLVLYVLAIVALIIFGVLHLFTFHFVLLGKQKVSKAFAASRDLVRKHWKRLLPGLLALFGILILLVFLIVFLFLGVPMVVLGGLENVSWMEEWMVELLTLCLGLNATLVISFAVMLLTPVEMLELTRFYYLYTEGEDGDTEEKVKKGWLLRRLALILVGSVLVGAVVQPFSELVFPEPQVEIIAHRAGGTLAAENTTAGLEAAIEKGVYGSEIDVQRTKDGHYVVNHDNTFKRLSGESRASQEMTLEEIRQLSVKNTHASGAASEPVATLEEMLETVKDREILFIELKGETADTQMADDVAQMIYERDMRDNVVVISLKYDLIDYCSTRYPDIPTGLLYFASYGSTQNLNCDYLILEEEAATDSAIDAIHDAGKKAVVWTVNTEDSMEKYLSGEADAIITDEVAMAVEKKAEIQEQTDLQRMWDMFWDIEV
ncbi:MAG: glycerophosphoryl diester phosphodiesterase membrane domain-containing protein [Eubacteriales bacterium]|nr:glycerophosphoryl diester phosphodiesterase membrane domain-containing protein [Eubacteriales bacterium]